MNHKPNFVKYPEIPYVEGDWHFEDPLEVFEKLDGSNCQVRCWGRRIWPGNRSKFLDNRAYDNPTNLGYFAKWMAHFKKWTMRNESLYNIPQDCVIFGEWLTGGQVRYPKEAENQFYLIDVAKIDESGRITEFLEYETAVNQCRQWGIEGIKFPDIIWFGKIARGDLPEILEKSSKSRLAIGELEGVVMKDYLSRPQRFAKYLSPPYTEVREAENNPQSRYITPTRVRKSFLKIVESGVPESSIDELLLTKAILLDIKKETGQTADSDELRRVIQMYLRLLKRPEDACK